MPYYYLMASLPALAEGAPPPLSLDAFDTACREQLTPDDYAEWQAVRSGTGASAFARTRAADERHLRNTLARTRAARLGIDAAAWLREEETWSYEALLAVEEAYAHANPLERERALDRVRWRQAEAAAGTDPFALPAVLSYGVRLALAARWAGLDSERGRQVLEAHVQQAGVRT